MAIGTDGSLVFEATFLVSYSARWRVKDTPAGRLEICQTDCDAFEKKGRCGLFGRLDKLEGGEYRRSSDCSKALARYKGRLPG